MAGRTGRGPDIVAPEALMELMGPHIDSFNYFVERGLPMAVANSQPVEISHPVTNVQLRNILFSNCIFDACIVLTLKSSSCLFISDSFLCKSQKVRVN
ncbi:unnamed protein product [Calypogeia fissa]